MSDRDPQDITGITQPSDQASTNSDRADREQFAAFYRSFVPKLVGFLIRQGARVTVASDIVQETMLTAYRKWSEIDHPEAWARRVASRTLVRHLSRTEADPVEEIPEATSLVPSPDSATDWEERQEILRLLSDLPPRQRQVMAWTYDGYTPADIARELGIESETVRASLRKARRTLAERLAAQQKGIGR